MDGREHEDATTGRTAEREETDGRRVSPRGRDGDPAGERRSEPSGPSVVDLAQQPVVSAWTAYLTLLLVLAAVGFGLFGIFSDAIGDGVVDTADGITGLESTIEAAVSIPLTGIPYLAIVLAVFVGAFLGWRLERDRSTAYVTAGIGMSVATFVFWTLAALLGTIPLEVSIDIGGLFVNAILAGITAGLVAAGGVWATRTRAPKALGVQEHPRRTRSTRDARVTLERTTTLERTVLLEPKATVGRFENTVKRVRRRPGTTRRLVAILETRTDRHRLHVRSRRAVSPTATRT